MIADENVDPKNVNLKRKRSSILKSATQGQGKRGKKISFSNELFFQAYNDDGTSFIYKEAAAPYVDPENVDTSRNSTKTSDCPMDISNMQLTPTSYKQSKDCLLVNESMDISECISMGKIYSSQEYAGQWGDFTLNYRKPMDLSDRDVANQRSMSSGTFSELNTTRFILPEDLSSLKDSSKECTRPSLGEISLIHVDAQANKSYVADVSTASSESEISIIATPESPLKSANTSGFAMCIAKDILAESFKSNEQDSTLVSDDTKETLTDVSKLSFNEISLPNIELNSVRPSDLNVTSASNTSDFSILCGENSTPREAVTITELKNCIANNGLAESFKTNEQDSALLSDDTQTTITDVSRISFDEISLPNIELNSVRPSDLNVTSASNISNFSVFGGENSTPRKAVTIMELKNCIANNGLAESFIVGEDDSTIGKISSSNVNDLSRISMKEIPLPNLDPETAKLPLDENLFSDEPSPIMIHESPSLKNTDDSKEVTLNASSTEIQNSRQDTTEKAGLSNSLSVLNHSLHPTDNSIKNYSPDVTLPAITPMDHESYLSRTSINEISLPNIELKTLGPSELDVTTASNAGDFSIFGGENSTPRKAVTIMELKNCIANNGLAESFTVGEDDSTIGNISSSNMNDLSRISMKEIPLPNLDPETAKLPLDENLFSDEPSPIMIHESPSLKNTDDSKEVTLNASSTEIQNSGQDTTEKAGLSNSLSVLNHSLHPTDNSIKNYSPDVTLPAITPMDHESYLSRTSINEISLPNIELKTLGPSELDVTTASNAGDFSIFGGENSTPRKAVTIMELKNCIANNGLAESFKSSEQDSTLVTDDNEQALGDSSRKIFKEITLPNVELDNAGPSELDPTFSNDKTLKAGSSNNLSVLHHSTSNPIPCLLHDVSLPALPAMDHESHVSIRSVNEISLSNIELKTPGPSQYDATSATNNNTFKAGSSQNLSVLHHSLHSTRRSINSYSSDVSLPAITPMDQESHVSTKSFNETSPLNIEIKTPGPSQNNVTSAANNNTFIARSSQNLSVMHDLHHSPCRSIHSHLSNVSQLSIPPSDHERSLHTRQMLVHESFFDEQQAQTDILCQIMREDSLKNTHQVLLDVSQTNENNETQSNTNPTSCQNDVNLMSLPNVLSHRTRGREVLTTSACTQTSMIISSSKSEPTHLVLDRILSEVTKGATNIANVAADLRRLLHSAQELMKNSKPIEPPPPKQCACRISPTLCKILSASLPSMEPEIIASQLAGILRPQIRPFWARDLEAKQEIKERLKNIAKLAWNNAVLKNSR